MPDIPPAPPPTVEEVVITAARLPPREADAAFSIVELDAADLDTPRLDEALTRTPGVSLFRRTTSQAANPTTQGISLRAIAPSGAGRALVLLDGVPLNDPFGGWVLWSQLPPESFERVEIVRGAGAGPYGAGALTGVIDLYERGEGGLADFSAASFGGVRGAASAVQEAGRIRLFASGVDERSDGYVPVRGADRGAADTPLDLRATGGALRLDAPMGATDLSLRLGGYDESRGAGLHGARADASGWAASAALGRQPEGSSPGWRLQVWRRESDFANTSVAVAADRSGTTPANNQYATPAVGWGVNAALRGDRGAWDWEIGADARFAEGEVRERFRFMAGDFTRERWAGGRTSIAGVYAEATWSSGDWLLTGGARFDHWRSLDGFRVERDRANGALILDERSADAEGEVVTARAGVLRRLGDGLSWRAAAYSGFRAPTLNELHRPFRVGNDITEANSALEPERLSGIETGLVGETADWRWSAAVFWNRIDDPIANVTIGVGPGVFPRAGFVPAGGVLRQRRNAGRIEAVGIEAEAERRFGSVTARIAGAWTEAEVDGGRAAPQLTGKRPAQAPQASVTAGADWRAGDRLTLSASMRWESERYEDDLNSRVLDDGLTFDARADWRLKDGVGLYVAVENLTDAEIEVSETANGVEGYGPPRLIRAGLRLSW